MTDSTTAGAPTAAPGTVRPATPDDLAGIEAIEQAAFEPARRSSAAALRRALTSRFQQVLVLDIDNAIAGYIVLWPFPRSWRVYNLAAHPAYRNRGIGGTLLSAAVDRARAAGARRVILESRTDADLVRFYEQRGFARRRRLPDYYAPGEHAWRLELVLTVPAGTHGLDLA